MKNYYRVGGDIFVACAFIASVAGGVMKVLSMAETAWILSPTAFLKFAAMCLLFSMALSLLDISQKMQ